MDEKSSRNQHPDNRDAKQDQLDQFRVRDSGEPMTTQEGKKGHRTRTN